jgi:hypothetical protein
MVVRSLLLLQPCNHCYCYCDCDSYFYWCCYSLLEGIAVGFELTSGSRDLHFEIRGERGLSLHGLVCVEPYFLRKKSIWAKKMMWRQGLKSLTAVALTACYNEIPVELSGLSALTSLDLSYSEFPPDEGWPWWPTDLSRWVITSGIFIISYV